MNESERDKSERDKKADDVANKAAGCGFIVFFVIPIALGVLMLLVLIYEMVRPALVRLLK